MKSRSGFSGYKGFTLVEIVYTVFLTTLVLGLATGFYVETVRGHYVVDQRTREAFEMRRFSQDLIYTASRANQIYLYRSAAAVDFASPAKQLAIVSTTDAYGDTVLTHPAGDFVVFVFYEIPKPTAQVYHRIQKIVGYYLGASDGGIGPIKRITIDLTKNIWTNAALDDQVPAYDGTKTTVETVLSSFWSSSTHTRFDTFALNARGLFRSETTTETAGRLFYYRDSMVSLMVAGQLYGAGFTSDKNTYTDTFSFSVTPRS